MNSSTDSIYSVLKVVAKNFNNEYLLREIMETDIMVTLARISLSLCMFLFVISISYVMYQKVTYGRGQYLDVIVKSFLVIFLLSTYPAFFLKIPSAIDKISLYMLDTTNKESLEHFDKVIEEENVSKWEKVIKFFKNVINVLTKINELSLLGILTGFVFYISVAILVIIFVLRAVSLTLLTILAPFCIISLILKPVSSLFYGWLKSYINVLVWPIFVSFILFIQSVVLDLIEKKFIGESPTINAEEISSTMPRIILFAYYCIFVFLLLKSMTLLPKLMAGTGGSMSFFEAMMMGRFARRMITTPARIYKKVTSNFSKVKSEGQSKMGKGVSAGGKAVSATGKSMEFTGKGVETTGKGVSVVGKGTSKLGSGMVKAGGTISSTGIGAIVGVPMAAVGAVATVAGAGIQGAGKGLQVTGKGLQVSGKVVNKTGKAVDNVGKKIRKIDSHKKDSKRSDDSRVDTDRRNEDISLTRERLRENARKMYGYG